MANKRGGLSKREYAAQKATTQAKKNASVRATASKSVAPLVGAGPLTPGQTRQAPLAGPSLPGKVSPGYYDYSNNSVNLTGYSEPSKKSSSSSSSKKTSTPKATTSLAPTVENANRASANSSDTISQGKAPSAISRAMASIGQMWGNYGTGRAPDAAFYTPQQRQANLNAGLGIEGAQASGPSALGLALAKGSTPDSPTGSGPNGETYYNDFDPAASGGMTLRSDFATPGTDFSRPGSEAAYNRGESPISYGAGKRAEAEAYGSRPAQQPNQNKAPRRIVYDQTPQFTPRTSQPESITPQFTSIVPDYTPVSTGQPGTQRRFLGNGMLSNGIASNGKLDQNLDGLSYGSAPSDEDSLLRELLGINTAQAADLPQQMAFGNKTTPMSSFQSGFESGGLTLDPGYSMPQVLQRGMQQETQGTNENYAPRQMAQNPGGSQGGGVSQQYSQGATGGNTMDGYYNKQLKSQNKAFSAQEKAQKKALKELLKSIKSQYGTQQSTGLDQLNKSKQEDLLKLSGLFQFANQDPNSEQRIQYEQRANQDYAGQQGDFLAKLAAAQAQEESRARQGYQSQISDIAGQRNDARSKIEELIFNARQQAQKGGGTKALSGTAAGSVTYMGDNASGEPVYRNNQTGEMQVGTGLTRKSQDPYAQMIDSIMGQQQGGQVQYDENGRPYIEQ